MHFRLRIFAKGHVFSSCNDHEALGMLKTNICVQLSNDAQCSRKSSCGQLELQSRLSTLCHVISNFCRVIARHPCGHFALPCFDCMHHRIAQKTNTTTHRHSMQQLLPNRHSNYAHLPDTIRSRGSQEDSHSWRKSFVYNILCKLVPALRQEALQMLQP